MIACGNKIFVHFATSIERTGNEGEREAVGSTSSIALMHFTKLEVHNANFQNCRKPRLHRGIRVWLVRMGRFVPGRYFYTKSVTW